MKAQIKPRINLEGRTPLQDVIPLATPFIIYMDPASLCNFQCRFCPTGDRELIKQTGRYQGVLSLDLFKKCIDDLADFPSPLKVLRLYKDGEPLLNPHLAQMVAYAKKSGKAPYIDTTTNGSLITPERMGPLVEAGLDKINISIDGMSREHYKSFTKFDMNFEALVSNVQWLYQHRGNCEVVLKIPAEIITPEQKDLFYQTFGNYCDRIFVENTAPCWPEFDIEARMGVKIEHGIYQQEIGKTDTCPYIFYAMSINSNGLASACFLDWGRKLIVGDAKKSSLKSIWNSPEYQRLRIQNLQGLRCEHPVCKTCGQLSHCLPDNIDPYREEILARLAQTE
jgi:MoaA/NifB/PqqE/SkfB family radical SAM enzyme